jgi:hypothetical protein
MGAYAMPVPLIPVIVTRIIPFQICPPIAAPLLSLCVVCRSMAGFVTEFPKFGSIADGMKPLPPKFQQRIRV